MKKLIELLRDPKGFTLLEASLAALLLVIVLGAAYQLLPFGSRSYLLGEQRIDEEQNLRIALDRVSRELRFAARVVEAGPTWITFTMPAGNTVRYYFDADDGELQRETNGGANIVAYGLSSVAFGVDNTWSVIHISITSISGLRLNTAVNVRVAI